MADLDFSLKAINAIDKNFVTTRIIIPPLASQIESTINIPKMVGYTQLSKKFGNREIKVQGLLKCTSPTDLITKIEAFSDFLFNEGDEQLIFNNQPTRYFNAQHIKTIELLREEYYAMLLLEFNCNDPFPYAVTGDEIEELAITVNGHTWNVSNAGQYYAYPVITITFNQNQTHIYIQNNTITDSRFDISKSFSNGNVLKINSKTMVITLDNVHSPAGFGDGGDEKADIILIKVGNNEFEVGTDDATLNVDIKVNFNKTYL